MGTKLGKALSFISSLGTASLMLSLRLLNKLFISGNSHKRYFWSSVFDLTPLDVDSGAKIKPWDNLFWWNGVAEKGHFIFLAEYPTFTCITCKRTKATNFHSPLSHQNWLGFAKNGTVAKPDQKWYHKSILILNHLAAHLNIHKIY